LVVRGLAQGAVEALDRTAVLLACREEADLRAVGAGETVRGSDPDIREPGRRTVVAQPIPAGPAQGGAAVAVVADDGGLWKVPPVGGNVGPPALDWLVNTRGLGVQPGRHPDRKRAGQDAPPQRCWARVEAGAGGVTGPALLGRGPESAPSPAGADRRDPTAMVRPGAPAVCGPGASGVAWPPPGGVVC
jgi:hypothetical protein